MMIMKSKKEKEEQGKKHLNCLRNKEKQWEIRTSCENKKKTRSKRKVKAIMSIKIEQEFNLDPTDTTLKCYCLY